MKIHPELLTELSDAIFGALAAHPHLLDVYAHGVFPRAQSVKDLNTRLRWDLFFAATHSRVDLRNKFREFNDSHIDTALRAIVPSIEDQRGTMLALAFAEGSLTMEEGLREIRTRFPAYVVSREAGSAKITVTGYGEEAPAKEKFLGDNAPNWGGTGAPVVHLLGDVSRIYKFPNGARSALRVHSPEGTLK